MSLFNTLVPSFSRRPGPAADDDATPPVRPLYRVTETPEAYGLTVHLPGVSKDGLEITAEEDTLRIAGRRGWKRPEGATLLHRETSDASYELVLGHDHRIDAEKIHAELKDGVLRLSLPKTEAVKPRKIAVA